MIEMLASSRTNVIKKLSNMHYIKHKNKNASSITTRGHTTYFHQVSLLRCTSLYIFYQPDVTSRELPPQFQIHLPCVTTRDTPLVHSRGIPQCTRGIHLVHRGYPLDVQGTPHWCTGDTPWSKVGGNPLWTDKQIENNTLPTLHVWMNDKNHYNIFA